MQLLNNRHFNVKSISLGKIFTANMASSLYLSFSMTILTAFATISLAVRAEEMFDNVSFCLADKVEKFLNIRFTVVGCEAVSFNNCKQITKCFACKIVFKHKRQYQNNTRCGCDRSTRIKFVAVFSFAIF